MRQMLDRRPLSHVFSCVLASLGLFVTMSCAKQPAATFEVVAPPAPQIESVTHGAPDGVRPGDSVSVTLRGDPGLQASASIPGVADTIHLSEDSAQKGVYKGSVVVPQVRSGSYSLQGRLQVPSDATRTSTMDGPSLTVLPPVPVQPPAKTAADWNAEKVLKPIYFDFDRDELRADALKTLEANAEWLRAHDSLKLVIEGHCDERGTNEYNMALGDRRANSARNYLINTGIAADRIRTISYGEERPVALGHDEASWALNRRDEFVLED